MKNPKDGFIRGRIRSLKFAFKGLWILVTTEDSIKAQLFFAVIAIILGFIKDIAAGAPTFAALISLIIAGIIYIPKISTLF